MAQFRFGNFDFPDELIKPKEPINPNQRQSIDAYTDDTGVTRDFGLPHTKTQIQFTTLPMSANQFRNIMDNLVANYIDYLKRNLNCKYYDDENGTFKTGEFYLDKSMPFIRKKVDKDGIPLEYDEMTWTFIEY